MLSRSDADQEFREKSLAAEMPFVSIMDRPSLGLPGCCVL